MIIIKKNNLYFSIVNLKTAPKAPQIKYSQQENT